MADMPRQNSCPKCGRYDWAHPFAECALTVEQCREAYEQAMAAIREVHP